ncbi:MAG: hypothetical protein ACM3XZ_08655 [Betaproteobacteria bacterium]
MSRGRPLRTIILAAVLALAAAGATAERVAADGPAPAGTVREVKVELTSPLPEAVAQRIREALAAVAAKALQGQEIETVTRLRPAVEKVVAEVFDRVLTGYETTGVAVVPGETTEVRLSVAPVGPVIREVYTRLAVEGIDPALQPLLREALPALDRAGQELLGGLPVQAFSWARFALEPLLEQELQRLLPGFKVETQLEMGEVTTVAVRLVPQGERVRRVDARLASDTIPAVALRQLSEELNAQATIMIGLPVAFLEAYRDLIQQEVERRIDGAPSIAGWGLKVRTRLTPDVHTVLEVGIESTVWRFRLEAVVNAGSAAPGPELRLIGGRSLGPGELLVGSQMLLTGLKTTAQLGIGVPVDWGGQLSYLWNLGGGQTLRLQKRISSFQRWGLERNLASDNWQAYYGVAANENLTVELVVGTGGAMWLSLVGNL